MTEKPMTEKPMTEKKDQGTPGPPAVGMYTETLARLYLQQGFMHEALQIYHRLAQERPDDQRLQDQIKALQQQLAAEPSGPVARPVEAQPAASARDVPGTEDRQTHQIIAYLERWLHYLQQQRGALEDVCQDDV